MDATGGARQHLVNAKVPGGPRSGRPGTFVSSPSWRPFLPRRRRWNGWNIGALEVIDEKPREFTIQDQRKLRSFAHRVQQEIGV